MQIEPIVPVSHVVRYEPAVQVLVEQDVTPVVPLEEIVILPDFRLIMTRNFNASKALSYVDSLQGAGAQT